MRKTTKLVIKEIKQELNKWRGTPCSWIGRLDIVKMSCYKQLDIQNQHSSNQNHCKLFWRNDKLILKLTQKGIRPRIAYTIFKEKKVELLTLPDFETTIKLQ